MTAQKIEVSALKIETKGLTIVGDTPLIVHRFAEKAKKAMLDKQQKKASKAGREARDPDAEYQACFYRMAGSDDAYGFPVLAFKAAAVRAAKQVPDMAMTDARGYFHILADKDMLVGPLRYSSVEMVEDMVRIGRGTSDLRYRPYFYDWEIDLSIRYNVNTISFEQIVALFDIAGFSVGVGEWRPERDGQYGMFHVKPDEE